MGQSGYRIGAASDVFSQFMRPSRYKALFGGRGGAKSQFFAECMVANAGTNLGFSAVCIREVQKSIKSSVKKLIEKKIIEMGFSGDFDVKNDYIRTPGKGEIIFQGMQDHTADSVKSLEDFKVAYVEEAQTLSSRSLELLKPTIRAEGSELWFAWNPRNASDPVDKFFRGTNPPENAIISQINYSDNKLFPSELEEERLHDYKFNPDRYAHIWLGEYEPQAIGAIWNMANIHSNRRHEEPTLGRVLVSVDPAISNEEHSDEHGIIVGGLGEDKRGYILEDASMKGSPQQWAERAVAMFDKYDADAIVVERNQGGDMVKHTLKTVRPSIPVVEVHATRGKHVRAEPISSLYAVGQVSHVGTFTELENQMCRMTAAGYDGEGSPDRCDALVWLLTELFPKIVTKAKKRTSRRPRTGGWMGG